MRIRRPIAALFTALTLFGGGVTMTACGDPATPNEGTTDDDSGNTGGSDREDDLPDNSDPEQDTEDEDDDSQDPD
jgi:hypothetical protein